MSAGNSTYSPLPQSNSDSDGSSEEELHVTQGNRIINRATKTQNSKTEKALNETKSNIINYKPLDSDGDVGVTLSKFHSNPDEVSILKPYGSLEIFSTSRKICFVFSLLLCGFTTVAFIWILPCNVGTCPSTSDLKLYNYTWEKTLPNLEIFGPNSLVPSQGRNYYIVFLTRSHLGYAKNYSESSLWCLKGKDGSLNWKITLNNNPTDVDCKLIDANADGLYDCLIYGKNFLKAINSLTGKEIWDFEESNKKEMPLFFQNFPLIVSDLNRDEINELILLSSFVTLGKEGLLASNFENYIVTVSGKTGEIINKPLQIKSCSSVHNFMFEESCSMSYICRNSDEEDSFENVSLTEVYQTLKNSSNDRINFLNCEMLNQHLPDSNRVYVNGFRLNLVNQGNCPQNCSVVVDIKDERKKTGNKTVSSFKKKNTYGMLPVVLKTARESGFILKFWKWCSKKENCGTQNGSYFLAKKNNIKKNILKNIRKRSKKLNLLPNTSMILDTEMLSESKREFQRIKRTANGVRAFGKTVFNSEDFNLHVICEIVVKVTVNGSHILTENLTKDEIIQICKKPQICQPDVYQQRHSSGCEKMDTKRLVIFILIDKSFLIPALIAYIDDVEEKLITYTSMYVHVKENIQQNAESWQLQSKISVSNL